MIKDIPIEINDDEKKWILHTVSYDKRVIKFAKKNIIKNKFVRTRKFENGTSVHALYTLKPSVVNKE